MVDFPSEDLELLEAIDPELHQKFLAIMDAPPEVRAQFEPLLKAVMSSVREITTATLGGALELFSKTGPPSEPEGPHSPRAFFLSRPQEESVEGDPHLQVSSFDFSDFLGSPGLFKFRDGKLVFGLPQSPEEGSDEEAQVMGLFSDLVREEPNSPKVNFLMDFYRHHESLSEHMLAQQKNAPDASGT